MKRVIREEILETSSSSVHSLAVKHNNPTMDYYIGKPRDDGYLHVKFDEFGWGYDRYYDAIIKLKYALQMAFETEVDYKDKYNDDDEETLGNFYETAGFNAVNDLVREKLGVKGIIVDRRDDTYYPYGYIDHQSTEGYHSLADFLSDYGVDLEDMIFNEDVVLIIDNDNH